MTAADDLTGGDRQDETLPAALGRSQWPGGTAGAQTPTRRLDFDVVIATRNRPEALALSIPLILGQSRQPTKLIVIDSSDDHAAVVSAVAAASAGWSGTVIVEHTGPGSAYQRNRGLAHVEAEVVVFPDDDSLFHPGASEAIMRPYELDTGGRIAGVCAADAREPPPGALSGAHYDMTSSAKFNARAQKLRRWLNLEFNSLRPTVYLGRLLRERAAPLDWFEAENCVLVEYLAGYRMSFRTAVIRANPFDETLKAYAVNEDLDASFSAMRHGCLVGARNARVYHHKFPSARADPYTFGLINLLNPGYVALKHVHDAGLSPVEAKRVRWVIRQNCRLMVLRRLPHLHKRDSREEVRGMLAALAGIRAMQNASREDLARVYSESLARRPS